MEALALSGVPATYNLVTDRSTLDTAIGNRLNDATSIHQAFPVIHLSLHGNNEGIALTSGDFLTWHELRQVLVPINQSLDDALLVCLSSCFSASGCRMAMYANQPLPFFALVGHPEKAAWADAAIAFVTFYHRLSKGALLPDAVAAMKAASGDDRFSFNTGPDVQQRFTEFLKKKRLDDFRAALARRAATSPSPSQTNPPFRQRPRA